MVGVQILYYILYIVYRISLLYVRSSESKEMDMMATPTENPFIVQYTIWFVLSAQKAQGGAQLNIHVHHESTFMLRSIA